MWEYLFYHANVWEVQHLEVAKDAFNGLGVHGWELVSTLQTFREDHAPARSVPSGVVCIFKRRKK